MWAPAPFALRISAPLVPTTLSVVEDELSVGGGMVGDVTVGGGMVGDVTVGGGVVVPVPV
ncbi:hypothetical protein C9427_09200 [Mesorhizobium helmanticense]|uniref:Uncharacterized protein n=1 Tax=Mesorhizobium helmanticense TaxID=1776423 RepID=A0A2T4IYH1_9HYPH|nr:hypothetical protein C9427_09200 [Mesorhizobium helmanticense]